MVLELPSFKAGDRAMSPVSQISLRSFGFRLVRGNTKARPEDATISLGLHKLFQAQSIMMRHSTLGAGKEASRSKLSPQSTTLVSSCRNPAPLLRLSSLRFGGSALQASPGLEKHGHTELLALARSTLLYARPTILSVDSQRKPYGGSPGPRRLAIQRFQSSSLETLLNSRVSMPP